MKRTPLKRKKPIKRTSSLNRAKNLVKKAKRNTRQRERTAWIKACMDVRSKIVRIESKGVCAWCDKTKMIIIPKKDGSTSLRHDIQDHHILARSLCDTMGHIDPENGMPLCYRCHIHRLKAEPDEYIEARDRYLESRGTNYQMLKIKYGKKKTGITVKDLEIYHDHVLLPRLKEAEEKYL